MEESCGGRPGFEIDSVRSGKKQRKDNAKESSSGRKPKLVFRGWSGKLYDSNALEMKIEKRENPVTKGVSVNEKMKVGSQQQTSPSPEPVSSHLQGFMLLMRTLCPKETAMYPGWDDGNDSKISSMAEPNKRKSMDFDCIQDKVKLKRKGNKTGNMEIETIELSDSDEEPIMDIPIEVLRRPSSEYKDRLIEELKRPFDECDYRDLMNKSTLRTKKIVYKELRPMENEVETEATRRNRVRAIETQEDSKSFFDWYPGLERKVIMATRGRRLSLLRGFFFWLQNSSREQSFKPWHRGGKGSKTHHHNNSVIPK